MENNLREIKDRVLAQLNNAKATSELEQIRVGVLGKNGCGKADLIRMAEGYGGSYDGDVTIGGRRVTHKSRGHHMASLVNDVPIIGTPRMEISHILRAQGLDRETAAKRLSEAAEIAGIADKLDVRYSKLNREEQLRAGLARAYAARAKVALMIDPFTGVELRMAARMRIAVMEFRAKADMIFVMSTNSPASAMSLATRIVVMDEGSVLQSETAQNIYDYPADRFVAEYFGTALINMIPAKLERAGEEVHAVFGETRILIPAGKIAKLVDQSYIGKKVLLGVRPENVHYEQAFISLSPESAFEAMVRHIELMGSETYLHLELDGVGAVNGIVEALTEMVGAVEIQVTPARSGTAGNVGVEALIRLPKKVSVSKKLHKLESLEHVLFALQL